MIRNYIKNQDGATAIEYGLIAGGVALMIFADIMLTGSNLQDIFDTVNEFMNLRSDV